jgi:DNA-binding NarL/FixJ family response regulator
MGLQQHPVDYAEPGPLTARQVQVFVIVTRYYDTVGDPCPARHVADRLSIHHEAVRNHFAALCRKGWLRSRSSPATPAFLAHR